MRPLGDIAGWESDGARGPNQEAEEARKSRGRPCYRKWPPRPAQPTQGSPMASLTREGVPALCSARRELTAPSNGNSTKGPVCSASSGQGQLPL